MELKKNKSLRLQGSFFVLSLFIFALIQWLPAQSKEADLNVLEGILVKNGLPNINTASLINTNSTGRIVTVDISNLGITILPPEIGLLDALTSLSFAKNQISEIPIEIGHLGSLKILNAGYNRISTLPSSIRGLNLLQTLDVSHNRLKSIPPEIGQLEALVVLDATNNQLETIPSQLGNCLSLRNLRLSSNRLISIPNSITNLTSLFELHLSMNRLSSLPENIVKLTTIAFLDNNRLCGLSQSLEEWIEGKSQGDIWKMTQYCEHEVSQPEQIESNTEIRKESPGYIEKNAAEKFSTAEEQALDSVDNVISSADEDTMIAVVPDYGKDPDTNTLPLEKSEIITEKIDVPTDLSGPEMKSDWEDIDKEETGLETGQEILEKQINWKENDIVEVEPTENLSDEILDAPTRRSTSTLQNGQFEGFFLEKKAEKDQKEVNVLFIFSDQPVFGTTFVDYYDSTGSTLVLDFYDNNIGSSELANIIEHPITKTEIKEVEIDLNRGVPGLKPDMRSVVRIKFRLAKPFPYVLEQDEFSNLTLKFAWGKKFEKSYWKISRLSLSVIGIVLLSGAVTAGIYLFK